MKLLDKLHFEYA